jgi:hypothetical protein
MRCHGKKNHPACWHWFSSRPATGDARRSWIAAWLTQLAPLRGSVASTFCIAATARA